MKAAILIAVSMLASGCSSLGSTDTASIEENVDCSPDSTPLCIEINRDATQVRNDLENLIIRHEGYRRNPYPDAGGLAIGYGRNLVYNGVSHDEALYLLRNDIKRITEHLTKRHESFSQLDNTRRAVLVSMGYNMGLESLSEFTDMWNAIDQKRYNKAASEIVFSKYCGQVGKRCVELANMMATGEYK